jgi:preprotein translocase subunit SecE
MAGAKQPNPRRLPGSRRESKAEVIPTQEDTIVTSTADKQSVAPPSNKFQELQRFLKGVRAEFSRVTWPDRKTLQQATVVVLMTLFIFSVYLGLLDKVFGWAFGLGHR